MAIFSQLWLVKQVTCEGIQHCENAITNTTYEACDIIKYMLFIVK
jgi:dissimilatory sulfite reductase (desulfoviridin) alpha/beta subunit